MNLMDERLIIFGATGDVAKRYVFPALAQARAQNGLPGEVRITGIGRREWSTPQFQEHISDVLGQHRPSLAPGVREGLIPLLDYIRVDDVSEASQLRPVFHTPSGPSLIYLGLPSSLFSSVSRALASLQLPTPCPIIFEKPFGFSADEARELNTLLHRQFSEEQIFRLDHFLGMPIVSNLFDLRFKNKMFEPMWNRHHIRKVEILWDETLALEGRAGYYDRAGALKDMIQNHLLQLMALVAMEPVDSQWAPDFRDKKVQLFKDVRKLSVAEVKTCTARARYRAGMVNGTRIPDYAREQGVKADRKTETYAAITLWVENARWQGVPFILRSGKAVGEDRQDIAIHFRQGVGEQAGTDAEQRWNVLRFNLATDEIHLDLVNREGSEEVMPDRMKLSTNLPASPPLPAYGRLFLEALSGSSALFVRDDEVEEMWKVIQPIADAWADDVVPLQIYPAGSAGPIVPEPSDTLGPQPASMYGL